MLRLFRRRKAPPPPRYPAPARSDSPTKSFLTTKRYPLYYLPITKCGCTYLRNLLYYLDNDEQHSDPLHIHAHQARDLVTAYATPRKTIAESPFAFVVLRDPLDRFLSLYYDKAYGAGRGNFGFLQERLVRDHGFRTDAGEDAAAHNANCHALIDFLEANLAGETDMKINPHWRWQYIKLRKGDGLNLKAIPLARLDELLPRVLSPLIPDIAEKMAAVTARNEAAKPAPKSAIVDDALRTRVEAVYARDRALYQRALEDWAEAPG